MTDGRPLHIRRLPAPSSSGVADRPELAPLYRLTSNSSPCVTSEPLVTPPGMSELFTVWFLAVWSDLLL